MVTFSALGCVQLATLNYFRKIKDILKIWVVYFRFHDTASVLYCQSRLITYFLIVSKMIVVF